MDNDDLRIPDVSPELLMQTKLQIEKDLGLSGFQYQSVLQPKDLPHLVPELAAKMQELKSNQSKDIMKIVYRVDLTERQMNKVKNMDGDWSENMAKAIVLREFQKVVIRNKFK